MAHKIAIFADGTANTVGGNDSNVLRLCRLIDSSATSAQTVIYDPGVGTMTPFAELRASVPDGVRLVDDDERLPYAARLGYLVLGWVVGAGTERNIRQLYRELIRCYEPGDEVFLFGFSRGAFTARALAGLIYRCGVPRREHDSRIGEALALYRKHFEACRDAAELRELKHEAAVFRRTYSHLCNIRFLGVWDTVKSVGYLRPKNLPHTRHNPIVQTVRHALSLGERRSFYAATTWGGLDGDTRPAVHIPAHHPEDSPSIAWQDVQEVWFAGDHSDVGGSHAERELSDVALHWMIQEARTAGLRVAAPAVAPQPEKLSASDLHDALTRGRSRLFWRCLELVPRREIDNEPPPPALRWRFTPSGPRALSAALRNGVVTIHGSARRCYSEDRVPWKGVNCRFV